MRIGDWSLRLAGDTYEARVVAREFALALTFAATQPLLLQGEAGVSRKGPRDAQASYYYSRPQLALAGTLTVGERAQDVRGVAWLDHEWSTEYLPPDAQGWDWIGINFDDGGALMAFRMRAKDGRRMWAGGTSRDARAPCARCRRPTCASRRRAAGVRRAPASSIRWRSASRPARSTSCWCRCSTTRNWTRARPSASCTGRARCARLRDGRAVGRGYLELTGYGGPLKL